MKNCIFQTDRNLYNENENSTYKVFTFISSLGEFFSTGVVEWNWDKVLGLWPFLYPFLVMVGWPSVKHVVWVQRKPILRPAQLFQELSGYFQTIPIKISTLELFNSKKCLGVLLNCWGVCLSG